jgi:signal transduction histidine kinase
MTRARVEQVYNAAMIESRLPRMPPPWVIDTAIVCLLSLEVLFEIAGRGATPGDFGALAMTVPLLWRRRAPLAVGVVVLTAILFVGNIAAPAAIFAALVAAYSMGAYSPAGYVSLGALCISGIFVDIEYNGGVPSVPQYIFPFLLLIPIWIAGAALRTRQLRAERSEDRAARLEREQELTMRAALAEERSRIARELHDVLAHNVSVMVVQAGAARQVLTSSPGEAREALLAVESTGRAAMNELRNLLGLLSEEDTEPALAPQPGVESVPSLVERVRDAGLPVQLRIEGEPHPLPSGVDLAAYRIVQEALTNALKYSGLAPTEVVLDYRDAALKIEVLDDGAGESRDAHIDGSRRGLVGMRERVGMYGGTLEAGPRLDSGYAVRAWLPLNGSDQ